MTPPLLLVLAIGVQAHRPAIATERTVVSDPTISWLFAATFDAGDESFTLVLDYAEPYTTPVELFVPVRDAWADLRPAWAIVGPGLPTPDEATAAAIPGDLADGHGALVHWDDATGRPVYFEGVMRRTYWTSGSTAVHLPVPGTYELRVWSPDGTPGDVFIGFGVEEDFGGDAWGPIFSNWGTFAW